MSTNGTTKNLHQRIAAITAAVQVKATGKTAHGQQTISITDVEDALGELTAMHGVVTDYRWNEAPTVIGNEGKMSLWLAHITASLVNADTPTDHIEAELYDVGTSPSAAVSFALKRYYRALFHLATEEDENRSVNRGSPPQGQQTGGKRQDQQRPPATPPATAKPTLTVEQRAELSALNDALPEDLRLTPEGKKALIAEGFEAAKEALLARQEEANERVAGQPSLLPDTAEVGS